MSGIHDFPAFLLASFLLWITPGPDTMFILARSIALGNRAGVLSVLGIGTGIVVHTMFAALGLSAILARSAEAFNVVKYAGALYLVYLGIQSLRKRRSCLLDAQVASASAWRIYRQGVATNVLNPKVAIFFLAFLPQFVDVRGYPGPVPFLFLGGAFVLGGTLWCLGLATCAARATRALRHHPHAVDWLERISGCVYIALGLNLLRSRPHTA
jgi:threonine/homoserine/homoserine lactone efflux protein